MKPIIFFFSILFLLSLSACGQGEKDDDISSSPIPYEYEVVVPDKDILWGMTFLPDGSMLITKKKGVLVHFKNGEKHEIQGLPEIYNRGQGGLMDIAIDPQYQSKPWVYFTYASPDGPGEGGNTAIMRAKIENGQLVQKELLYKAMPNSTSGNHFGSRIAFDDEAYLYFTIGGRGFRDKNPQDLSRDGGKTYRLNRDGSVPESNPFVDKENAISAIFTYGSRNQQGMARNPWTGKIWFHEHGPQGGDEINIVEKGANYGWPIVTYGINYDGTPITEITSKPEFKDPIHYWVPSIAPSGMAFVTSDKYPNLNGDLLVGSLKFQYLEHLNLNGKEITNREKLLEGVGRIRDVIQGPDGFIYVSAEGKGIIKLTPQNQ